ncbi:MAG: LapA family protein [Pseudomonadales bacterium]
MHFTRYLLYALLALFLVFLAQNLSVVPVNFLFWKVELPRALLLVLTFALGHLSSSLPRLAKPVK